MCRSTSQREHTVDVVASTLRLIVALLNCNGPTAFAVFIDAVTMIDQPMLCNMATFAPSIAHPLSGEPRVAVRSCVYLGAGGLPAIFAITNCYKVGTSSRFAEAEGAGGHKRQQMKGQQDKVNKTLLILSSNIV
jgi:hypothetical protein